MYKTNYFLPVVLVATFLFAACSQDTVMNDPTEGTVWDGPLITFEKEDGADPDVAAGQDRITDNVWITRGNAGGQIYNVVSESSADKDVSPEGTLWAEGTLDEIDDLTFEAFRTAVGNPQDVVGKDLVLFLTEDEIYLSVRFTSWSMNMGGGFAYERSTE